MTLRNKFHVLLAVSLCVIYASYTGSYAATINVASAFYSDVNSAVSSASYGDTVVVPAGSATWSNTLVITKGINLIGAGIGNTVITRGATPIIRYSPSSGHNYAFRVSMFTFNMNSSGQAFSLDCKQCTPVQNKVRIDHIRAYNSNSKGAGVENRGCRGVIDNCSFENMNYPLRIGWGDGSGLFDWQNYPELFNGAANDNIYVEDCTFTGVSTAWTDADQGGRYALRYNTVTPDGSMYPLLDIHGGRGSLWGAMGAEVYGNQINGQKGFAMSHRGGRLLMFYNNATTSGSYTIKLYNNDGCPPDPYSTEQLHNSSYYFGNRHNTTGSLIKAYVGSQYCGTIDENSDWWQDDTSFDGNAGIGCGTLSQMQDISTCTEGVAFWVTTQSCSDLTGMVGKDPSTPIAGTLYRCNGSNQWIEYYKPYTYPHPLRGGNPPQPQYLHVVQPQ